MAIGDLKTEKGVQDLNAYLSERSYIDGWQPSQADAAVFQALGTIQIVNAHVLRWYNHIKSYDHATLPGSKNYVVTSEQHTEDIDLFGSDEEEDIEAAKIREERLKAYTEKKSKKPTLVAKSSIVIDVKPWDDETNMDEMEKVVRSIEVEGLIWGASKLVPVGYGIKKLQIMCVVEDEKVSVDSLVEQIQEFEDLVQSVDIAAFNKI
ncbi:elongation factor 1-beta' [Phymastichus coffea]|uniref:elongation factor 1-beta' n=1 Tax=Phymastichus coffea TaxID=108790 RepID=UPI00273B108F|nr:elongation factor 1-beta' [Phymastichus coffea]